MSWHYLPELLTNSHSSPELAEAYLEQPSSAGDQSAPWKLSRIVGKSSCGDSGTVCFPCSRSGTTSELSMGGRGMGWWISLLAASRVRISVPRDEEPESTGNTVDSGRRWPGSLAKYDHASRSWKTRQYSLLGGLTEFSETWPRWGLMRNGELFPRPKLGLHTKGSEYGFLPTPTKTDANGRTYHYSRDIKSKPTVSLLGVVKLLPTPAATDWKGKYAWETVKRRIAMTRGVRLPEELCRRVGKAIIPNPEFWEWMMGWPIGSTGLQPLEKDKYLEWFRQHGNF